MNPAVEFSNVSFAYEDTRVLSNVSFTVNENEYIGLIGPNGGGKTTLLQLLMGFSYSHRRGDQDFGQSPAEARNKIAYVPQAMRFDRDFPISVLEVVLSGKIKPFDLVWQIPAGG